MATATTTATTAVTIDGFGALEADTFTKPLRLTDGGLRTGLTELPEEIVTKPLLVAGARSFPGRSEPEWSAISTKPLRLANGGLRAFDSAWSTQISTQVATKSLASDTSQGNFVTDPVTTSGVSWAGKQVMEGTSTTCISWNNSDSISLFAMAGDLNDADAALTKALMAGGGVSGQVITTQDWLPATLQGRDSSALAERQAQQLVQAMASFAPAAAGLTTSAMLDRGGLVPSIVLPQ